MLSSISRCRFALSFGAFPGILYKKHCKRKKRLRIVVIHYRHFKIDSMGPTHECKEQTAWVRRMSASLWGVLYFTLFAKTSRGSCGRGWSLGASTIDILAMRRLNEGACSISKTVGLQAIQRAYPITSGHLSCRVSGFSSRDSHIICIAVDTCLTYHFVSWGDMGRSCQPEQALYP